MDFERLLRFAIDSGASDVHLQSAAPAMLRLGGQIRMVEGAVLTDEDMLAFLASIAPRRFADDIEGAAIGGLDFSHALPTGERFRCSAFRTLGRFGVTMRAIRTAIPSIEALNLPKVIHDIALARRGLTLVTGTTGSGKDDNESCSPTLPHDLTTHGTRLPTGRTAGQNQGDIRFRTATRTRHHGRFGDSDDSEGPGGCPVIRAHAVPEVDGSLLSQRGTERFHRLWRMEHVGRHDGRVPVRDALHGGQRGGVRPPAS